MTFRAVIILTLTIFVLEIIIGFIPGISELLVDLGAIAGTLFVQNIILSSRDVNNFNAFLLTTYLSIYSFILMHVIVGELIAFLFVLMLFTPWVLRYSFSVISEVEKKNIDN